MPTHKWKDLKDSRFPIMSCGCRSNGHRNFPLPVVPVCVTHNCDEVAKEIPNLEGRQAKCCSLCNEIKPSSFDLPMFHYQPDKDFDTWYNGYVHGWD